MICGEQCHARVVDQRSPRCGQSAEEGSRTRRGLPTERHISPPHPQQFTTMAQSLCVRNTFLQTRRISESCQAISLNLRPSRPCPLSRPRCPPFRSPFSSVHSRREQNEGSIKQPSLYAFIRSKTGLRIWLTEYSG